MLESTKHTSYSLDTTTDECLELSEEALNTLKVPGQPAHKIRRKEKISIMSMINMNSKKQIYAMEQG